MSKFFESLVTGIAFVFALSADANSAYANEHRATVELEETNGPDSVLVNCRWESKIVIETAQRAPAILVRCVRGGPGALVEEGKFQ